MEQYISKSALVTEIERLRKNQRLDDRHGQGVLDGLHAIERFINTLEVKEVDFCTISEYVMEAYEYLDFTHTSNLAHNKPMIAARLKGAIRGLFDARLFELNHDKKYRMENLGLKAQKREEV